MSDRAGDVHVTFVFHISSVGVSVFSLLKKVLMGILQIFHWYLVSCHRGFIFNLPGFDSCGE